MAKKTEFNNINSKKDMDYSKVEHIKNQLAIMVGLLDEVKDELQAARGACKDFTDAARTFRWQHEQAYNARIDIINALSKLKGVVKVDYK